MVSARWADTKDGLPTDTKDVFCSSGSNFVERVEVEESTFAIVVIGDAIPSSQIG
jgi:hypothetical protein